MTDLAFPAKFGGLAASGFTLGAPSRDPSAIAPKPCPARARMSRRVTARRICSGNIDEFIAIHQRQAEIRQLASRAQKLFPHRQLHRARRARDRKSVV